MTAPLAVATAPVPRRLRLPSSTSSLALWSIFVVAFAVRVAPMLRTGSLTGILGYDDGPLYSASANLLHGRLPYRDVVFGHPPGITLLLLPFTAFAHVVGDVTAMAAARLAVVAVGGVNAVLVTVYLRRFTPAWAIVGGLAYAVWRLPSGAERAVMFEPILALTLLAALTLLVDGRRPVNPGRIAASGVLMGVAAAVSLRAGPEIALIAGYLLVTRGWRTAGGWLSSAAVTAAAFVVPPALPNTGEFLQQISRGQLDRSGDVGLVQHLQRFSDLARLGSYQVPMAVDIMLATCVVVAVIAVALIAWWQPEAQLVVLLMGLQCVMVAAAPAYSSYRFALAAPVIVIATAAAAHRLVPDPLRGLARYTLAPGLAVALAGLSLTAVHNVVPRPPDPAQLRAFAAARHCVWFDAASLAIAADKLTPLLDEGCPVPLDRYADLADLGIPAAFDDSRKARRTRELQARLVKELDEADAAVVPEEDSEGVLGESFLGDDARSSLAASFDAVGTYGEFTLWVRR